MINMELMIRKLSVEILGTFLLTYVILTTSNYLAIGSTLALLVFLGNGSYNPAVALAQFLNKDISSSQIVAIIICELIGGSLAYYLNTQFTYN